MSIEPIPMITDWISSISSCIYTLLTFGILIVAIKAKSAWREELKSKKKFELASRLYEVLSEIEYFAINILKVKYKGEHVDRLKSLYVSLKSIELEYEILDINQDFIKYFIGKFSFCEEKAEDSILCGLLSFLMGIHKIETFDAKTGKKLSDNVNLERSAFQEKIKVAREFCKKEMKDFYKS